MRIFTLSPLVAISLLLISTHCYSLPSGHSDDLLIFQVIQAQTTFNSANIETATAVEQADNKYGIQIKLKPAAANEFYRITGAGIGKVSNFVFKGRIISSATIQSQLGGNFLIAGF